jgi:hypothetical protein
MLSGPTGTAADRSRLGFLISWASASKASRSSKMRKDGLSTDILSRFFANSQTVSRNDLNELQRCSPSS